MLAHHLWWVARGEDTSVAQIRCVSSKRGRFGLEHRRGGFQGGFQGGGVFRGFGCLGVWGKGFGLGFRV